uniref:Pentatricopeptide repeat-containing protein n=1 Tax=Oryza meridionalis TaxID=40149 RepID=A0A0E0E9F3_9ORYZ
MDKEALRLFAQMEAEAGFVPCETTMANVLPKCALSKAFADKEAMHGYVVKRGMAGNRFVQNTLMDMYARLGKTDVARRIFGMVDLPDIVSWNTLITGSVVQGHMQQQEEDGVTGVVPNAITLMTLLPGCAILAAPARGKEVHGYAVRHALDTDMAVWSALVDMYAKYGCLAVFDRLPRRDNITWNILIMAYGMHGLGGEAMALFNRMTTSGKCDHGVEPTPDVHAFVVDILGCAGRLEEAYAMVTSMELGNGFGSNQLQRVNHY